jgi:hypothetical protein
MCGAQNASDSFCIAEIPPPHGKGPQARSDPAEGLIKKGPLAVAGRPKSREETPKVGLDHAGRTQHVAIPHMGAFVLVCNWHGTENSAIAGTAWLKRHVCVAPS